MVGRYHVGENTNAFHEIKGRTKPDDIGFPFIGSYLSLAEDIGDEFGVESQLTPDTVNGAILAS